MIRKVTAIQKGEADDFVLLGWYDMRKPSLSVVSDKGVNLLCKVNTSHLHEGDLLVCEDGYAVQVRKAKDSVVTLHFDSMLDQVKTAYEIGNRHQPISIGEKIITILDDPALQDVIAQCEAHPHIQVEKSESYFKPDGHAHHSH